MCVGGLTDIVTVTKNHLHCLNNWGSMHKGFFFVKLILNINQISEIESERWNQDTNKIKDSKYLKQNNPIQPVSIFHTINYI